MTNPTGDAQILFNELLREFTERLERRLLIYHPNLALATGVVPTSNLPTSGNTGSGYSPAAHASSHHSGGSDPLALGSIAGTLTDAQHGNRAGGSLHSVASTSVAGFLSAADKLTIDGLPTTYQPLDSDLTAIAALTTTSFGRSLLTVADAAAARAAIGAGTGGGSVTSVDLTAPAAGLTVAGGPITTSGAITLALANDLAAVEGLSGTGLAVRTGTDAWTNRTITGTSNRLAVTNGDGVSGNPTLDISTSYVGQSSITTLGTIATGTWQATKIGLAYGGTNADLSAAGGSGFVLKQSSSGAAITSAALVTSDIPDLSATYQPLDADLTAIAAFSSTGLAARTASNTWAQRTITGTSNRLSVTNGAGVAGNPTLDIDSAYVGQSSITTLGTIATGVWQATKIGLAYGGTNADLSGTGGTGNYLKQASAGAAITVGTLLFTDLVYSGLTTGQVPRATSATAVAFGALDLANTSAVTGILPAANGGTGINNATRTLTISTNAGTLAFSAASSTLTVPATGTAALVGTDNQFVAQGFRAASASQASGIYAPWVSGDTLPTLKIGAATSGNNQSALTADSNSGNTISATSVSGVAVVSSINDTGTTNVPTVESLRHTTSGVPAAGFGAGLLFQLHSSNNTLRNGGQVAAVWETATDASRLSALTFSLSSASVSLAEVGRFGAGGAFLVNVVTPTYAGQGDIEISGTFYGGSIGINVSPTALIHAKRTDGNYHFKAETASRVYGWGATGTTFFLDDVTGAVRRVTIDSSGNLGLGTSSPASILDVMNGTMRAREGTNTPPSSGKGMELICISATSYLQSYNRDSSAWMPLNINASLVNLGGTGTPVLQINGTQVLSTRKTGWTAATGTATRTSFATSTVTTAALAQAVKALLDDLISHGVIGT
jgi:hypothetical protein